VVAALLLAAGAALLGSWWAAGPPGGLGPLLAPPGAEAAAAARTTALKLARSALLLLLVALATWRRASREPAGARATAALLLVGAADLVAVGRGVNPLAPADLMDRRPALVDVLAGEAVRLHAPAPEPTCREVGPGPEGWQPRWTAALAFHDALRPPSGAQWGLRGSYDGEFTGLGSRWSAPFDDAAGARLGTPGGTRLLQIGGVSHVLRVGRSAVPGLERPQTLPSFYACPLQVQRVPDPLPRAYVVSGERRGADPKSVLGLLLDPGFDPRREVVLDEARPAAAPASGGAEVRVVSSRLDTMELEADLGAPGVLVLLEAFDPGWRAAVDGAEAKVLRANGLFRAVRLPGGRHRVLLSYRPRSAAAGALLALFGVAAAAVALGLRVRRAWRARAGAIVTPVPGG
ncbi:MAG TPA: YfhO family protein, partial [Vicinamibacteria bacterium]|nr:YfhO family protein [Vicinamibacteria bacterium]